jgi:hypothetical protein
MADMNRSSDERQYRKRMERRLAVMDRKLDALLIAQNIELNLEIQNMADFSELIAKVEKINGTVASTKVTIQGFKAKIEELAGQISDTDDQAKVMELAASIGAIEGELAAAIAANPDTGGSQGGVT